MTSDGIDVEPVIEVVERIMTMHWDMKSCECWVCTEARAAGCRPRQKYPTPHDKDREYVRVDWPKPKPEPMPPVSWRAAEDPA